MKVHISILLGRSMVHPMMKIAMRETLEMWLLERMVSRHLLFDVLIYWWFRLHQTHHSELEMVVTPFGFIMKESIEN